MVDRIPTWLSRFQPLCTCAVASFTLKWEWDLWLCYGTNGAKIPTTMIVWRRTVSLQAEGTARDGSVRGCREQDEIFPWLTARKSVEASVLYIVNKFYLRSVCTQAISVISNGVSKHHFTERGSRRQGRPLDGHLTPQRNQFCHIQILDPKETEGSERVCTVAQ